MNPLPTTRETADPVRITGLPCTLLPRDAREQLIQASRVKDPQHRLVAIDAAIDSVRARYPDHFQPQESE
jgi:hypothetical protein